MFSAGAPAAPLPTGGPTCLEQLAALGSAPPMAAAPVVLPGPPVAGAVPLAPVVPVVPAAPVVPVVPAAPVVPVVPAAPVVPVVPAAPVVPAGGPLHQPTLPRVPLRS
ncbi:hypothetical protein BZL30_1519 [Mycobacterium kansasii]|uniref:Uncharacterized protein n=1 Tax=Mycobacterium kansasii TaxID=1768 RepID=A0A1V3XS78_MYCKA|nr:hypothetical protein BZL30_1519 [Mycobacterium kansasii]